MSQFRPVQSDLKSVDLADVRISQPGIKEEARRELLQRLVSAPSVQTGVNGEVGLEQQSGEGRDWADDIHKSYNGAQEKRGLSLKPKPSDKLDKLMKRASNEIPPEVLQDGAIACLEWLAEQSGMDTADKVQMVIGVLGIFDPTPTLDLINAAISLFRGNLTEAGVNILSALPGLGCIPGAAKIVKFLEPLGRCLKYSIPPFRMPAFTALFRR